MRCPHAPALLLALLALPLPCAAAPLVVRWEPADGTEDAPPDGVLRWYAWTPSADEERPALPEHEAGAVSPRAVLAEVPDDLAATWWTVALEGEWGARTWFAVAEGAPSAMPEARLVAVPEIEIARERAVIVLSWADPFGGMRSGAFTAWQVVAEGHDGPVVVAEVPANAHAARLDAPARREALALRPLYREGVAGPAGRFVEIEPGPSR